MARRSGQVVDTRTWAPRASLESQHDQWAKAAFGPDGKRVAVSAPRGALAFDSSGEETAKLRGHRGVVASFAFSPDGKRVVTTADDWTRVWDAETGDPVLALPGTESAV